VLSDALVSAVRATSSSAATLARLEDRGEQLLRGRSRSVRIWTMP
jgi:hypothetical protein